MFQVYHPELVNDFLR